MLHLHFGAGRLGLGLVAPFFQHAGGERYLLNRSESGTNATGATGLAAGRRNELLRNNPEKCYVIQSPGAAEPFEMVRYNGFYTYDPPAVSDIVREILAQSSEKDKGIIVTASVLTAENYAPVVEALNLLASFKENEENEKIGGIFLVACENLLSAGEVLRHDRIRPLTLPCTHRHVRCVHAMVDRMCVGLEEYPGGAPPVSQPTVAVQAEEYGMLKLALAPETEELPSLLSGSRVSFSRHMDVEAEIKSWLLNGSHWLIALTAFHETGGDVHLKLNEWINESEDHHVLAAEILIEMRDGVEILLRSEPRYRCFVQDVDVSHYLDEATGAILDRFRSTEDTMTRILARFRSPSAEEAGTLQSFTSRLLGRVDPPMAAYQRARGLPPRAATQSLFNLFRLQASGTFVDGEAVKKAA